MKLHPLIAVRVVSLVLLLSASPRSRAATNVVVWDTMARQKPVTQLTPASERAAWKVVPSDLLTLEKEPAKASSDPGYYGREYQFTGDVVVENQSLLVRISRESTGISIFSKTGLHRMDLQPLAAGVVRRCELVRNGADEVVLNVVFGEAAREAVAQLTLGKNEIIEISPGPDLRGLKVLAPLEYAVVPGFVGDDLVFGAVEDATGNSLALPSENMLLGLLPGEERTLVLTWPPGKQRVNLNLGAEKDKQRSLQSIEVENAGQPLYLAVLAAPGIWHREILNASFLEKDTPLAWKPPFSAKWQTQLLEGSTKTTYPFRAAKGTVWRGVPGSYNYPVWFDGETAFFHLSKKVPPKGESIIYFLEGSDTPPNVLTPVDILKATLGRAAASPILDVAGRKLRTHHGSSGSGVHRACTCGYTEAIQAVFERGEEVNSKSFIDQSINDMIYFVQRHLERIDEYREFARELVALAQNRARENPALQAYLEEIEQMAQQIPQEYENQKDNMKSLAYAGELSQKTLALCAKNDAKNLETYMELLKAWRGMGGAQDYVVAQYHTLTRKLFQEAGYLAASNPPAMAVAQEIRARCKQVLRNPDGYEIWPSN